MSEHGLLRIVDNGHEERVEFKRQGLLTVYLWGSSTFLADAFVAKRVQLWPDHGNVLDGVVQSHGMDGTAVFNVRSSV